MIQIEHQLWDSAKFYRQWRELKAEELFNNLRYFINKLKSRTRVEIFWLKIKNILVRIATRITSYSKNLFTKIRKYLKFANVKNVVNSTCVFFLLKSRLKRYQRNLRRPMIARKINLTTQGVSRNGV